MDSIDNLAAGEPVFRKSYGDGASFNAPGQPDPRSGPDLRLILKRVVRGSPALVAGLGLGLWAGVAVLRIVPAEYTSTAAMLIDPKRPGNLGADAAFANLVVDSSKVASVELVLTSSELLGRVVQAAHLDDDPAFGAARENSLRHWLSSLAPDLFRPLADTPEARRSRAIYRLGRHIRTERVNMTYVIDVSVSAASPALAQSLAISVVDTYLSDQVDNKISAARRDTAWLADELGQLRQNLSDSENAVESIRRRYGIVETDHATGVTLDRQAASDINTQLQQAEGQVEGSRTRYEQAQRVLNAHGSLDELPDVSGSPVIAGLRAKQTEAQRRIATLKSVFTNDYPELAYAQAEAKLLDEQVSAEMQRVVAGLRNAAQTSVALRDSLRQRLSALVSAASNTGQADGRIQLRQAERTLEADQLAYTATLTRLHDLEQQPARQTAEIRVISAPELPDAPSSPKPILFIGAGGALGLLAGLVGVLLLPLLRKRVEDIPAIGSVLVLPLLAAVPRLSRANLQRSTAPAYILANLASGYADSLRVMRAALGNRRGMPQVVQFTSATRGEGKSTLSASLAVSAALAGVRTAIVDLDFYHPSVSTLFNLPDGPGVSDVLAGAADAEIGQIWRSDLPLRVIAAGDGDMLLADRLDGAIFHAFMRALRDGYDLIVLDTPPVLATADAVLIARHADATIMVCAWRATPQKVAEQTVLSLRQAGARLAGLVVNKVTGSAAQTYPADYYVSGQRRRALADSSDAG